MDSMLYGFYQLLARICPCLWQAINIQLPSSHVDVFIWPYSVMPITEEFSFGCFNVFPTLKHLIQLTDD